MSRCSSKDANMPNSVKICITLICIALLLHILYAASNLTVNKCVPTNGTFTTGTYVKLEDLDLITPDSFTLCLWLFVSFLRGTNSFFVSYATEGDNNIVTGSFRIIEPESCRHSGLPWQVTAMLCKRTRSPGQCGSAELSRDDLLRKWTHLCFVYHGHVDGGGTLVGGTTMFLNGEIVAETPYRSRTAVTTNQTSGTLVIGQEQDAVGGEFDVEQAISGKVTEVNIWNGKLGGDAIGRMASCKELPQGDIASWQNSNWISVGAPSEDVPLSALCQRDHLRGRMVLLQQTNDNYFQPLCSMLGGSLPIFPSLGAVRKMHGEMLSALQLHGLKVGECQNDNRPFKIITAEKYLTREERWSTLSKKLTEAELKWLPNDDGASDLPVLCTITNHDGLEVTRCDSDYGCGVCDLPESHRWLILKGLCVGDVKQIKLYDVYYQVHGVKNKKPHFIGMKTSHIYFDPALGQWRLDSLRDPGKFLLLSDKMPKAVPLGRRHWTAGSNMSVCSGGEGDKVVLTLSNCLRGMFTCDDGSCISLSERCDTNFDCEDLSDESNCDYLTRAKHYVKELAPPPPKDSKSDDKNRNRTTIDVEIGFDLLALPSIETVNLKFTVDFFLSLKWRDPRLMFRNLHEDVLLNKLENDDLASLWTPVLMFHNALGPLITEVDQAASAHVSTAGGSPEYTGWELETESTVFEGNSTMVELSREYYMEFSCIFDLRSYPFDTQVCSMLLMTHMDSGFVLVKDKQRTDGGVKYGGNKTLLEYEILDQTLSVEPSSDGRAGGAARVRVFFRRRMEYHLTSTFMQTLVLIGVGYMSLFFRPDNFTDRIMVSITNMVVVATITSSVQSSVPKTFYFKLIDYWLVFCLNILVLLMVFHTFLAGVHHRFLMERRARSAARNKKIFSAERAETAAACKEQEEVLVFRKLDKINFRGKLFIGGLIAMVNVVFWSVAVAQYLRSYERLL